MSKKVNIPVIVLSVFLCFLLYKVYFQIVENLNGENGYTFGDWLINYEDGGFKRRGLSGSFLIYMYDTFGISLKKSAFVIQFAAYIILFLGIIRLAFRSSISYLYLGIIFSSCTFLFMYFDAGVIGRKEVLLFAFYVAFLNLIERYPQRYYLILSYLFITTVVGILFHEIYFFYLPFFVLPFVYNSNIKLSKKQLAILFLVIGGTAIFLVGVIKIFGAEINEGATFSILQARGLGERMSTLGNLGMLTWDDNFDKIKYFAYNQYWLYSISFLAGLLLFYVYSNITQVFKRKYDFLLITLITFLLSAPAYILAIDWGRWIHIQFMMMVLYITYLHKINKKVPHKTNSKLVVFYVVLVIVLGLFWRFDLVDKGFYLAWFKQYIIN